MGAMEGHMKEVCIGCSTCLDECRNKKNNRREVGAVQGHMKKYS